MFESPYAKMVCDTSRSDGGIYFYKEYCEWVSRANTGSFKIHYLDIDDVRINQGRKKEVVVCLKNGEKYYLYLYKADTLRQLLYEAIERLNNPVSEVVEVEESSKEDYISKLERLAKLHKSGDLTDEEFQLAKKKLLEN